MQRTLIALGLVLLLCFGTASYLGAQHPTEPAWKGTSLEAWLEPAFHWKNGTYVRETSKEFDEALCQMGTNAIPHLLRRLRRSDSRLAKFYLVKRHGILGSWLISSRNDWLLHIAGQNNALVERRRAVAGFKALGPLATNAIPELLALPKNPPGESGPALSESYEVIQGIGAAAYPSVVAQTHVPDGTMRIRALFALERLEKSNPDPHQNLAVQAWAACLKDSDVKIRRLAVYMLESAPPAQVLPILPALEKATNDLDQVVAKEAVTVCAKLKTSPAGF